MEVILDLVSVKRIEDCHPALQPKGFALLVNCSTKNLRIRITQGIRSYLYQDELYAQGRTKPGAIVTKAKGGESRHNFGVAIDICLLTQNPSDTYNLDIDTNNVGISDWYQVVQIAKDLGFEWGGDWKKKDLPHFQLTFGLSRQEMQRRYEKGLCDKHGNIYINKEQL